MVAVAMVAATGLGVGVWYAMGEAERARLAIVQEALDHASRTAEELKQAQARHLDLLKHAERLRAEEEAAGKSGSATRQMEARNARIHVEGEAQKQAALVQQREIAAIAARDEAGKANSWKR